MAKRGKQAKKPKRKRIGTSKRSVREARLQKQLERERKARKAAERRAVRERKRATRERSARLLAGKSRKKEAPARRKSQEKPRSRRVRSRRAKSILANTTQGSKYLRVRARKDRKLISAHHNAVQQWLKAKTPAERRRASKELRKFKRKSFKSRGKRYRFQADPRKLKRLHKAGELPSPDRIYRKAGKASAGGR